MQTYVQQKYCFIKNRGGSTMALTGRSHPPQPQGICKMLKFPYAWMTLFNTTQVPDDLLMIHSRTFRAQLYTAAHRNC